MRLYVYGDADEAWATQRELFLEHAIEWDALIADDLQHAAPVRQIVNGPGLAGALRLEGRTRSTAVALA